MYLPMQLISLCRASRPPQWSLQQLQSLRPLFSRPSLAHGCCVRFQLASPTSRSPILVSSRQMLLTSPPLLCPCLLTAKKRTTDSTTRISCGLSPSPISGFVLRTEEQMKRAELVSKYDLASLKVSESEIEYFVHFVTVVILGTSLCVLLGLKLKGILDTVVEKSSIWKIGKELFKVVLEELPTLLLLVQSTLLGICSEVLTKLNSAWHKQAAAVEGQKPAKLQLYKHNGDQAMKVARTAIMSLQAMNLYIAAFLLVFLGILACVSRHSCLCLETQAMRILDVVEIEVIMHLLKGGTKVNMYMCKAEIDVLSWVAYFEQNSYTRNHSL